MKDLFVEISELVALAIIIWVIWRYVAPFIRKAMANQLEIIEEEMSASDRAKVELAEAEAEAEQSLAEARTQAAQIRENARAEAQRTIEELRVQAQEESARIVARGEEQLSHERGAIVRELRGDIGALAVELSEKIVTERLSDEAEARATIDAFLTDLEQHGVASKTIGSQS
jgi:F-type H+-transporting ATPase subunit b